MNYKITIQYLLVAILLIVISFLIAYNFWWKIDLNSSQFFIIVFATMICWLGIGFLSILISGIIVFKNIEKIGFVSPFTLVFNGYFYKKFGIETAKKFKSTFSLIAFPTLFILIFAFYKIVNFVEYTDLTYYGIEKSVKIEDISYYKGNKRAQINFEFNNEKISKNLFLKDTLKKIGDFETIIFSSRNPNIVELKSEFEENSK